MNEQLKIAMRSSEPVTQVILPTDDPTAMLDTWIHEFSENQAAVPRRLVYVTPSRLGAVLTYHIAQKFVDSLRELVKPRLCILDEIPALENLSPDEPAIIIAPRQQATSALLFRAARYTHLQRPIYAALLGCDSLWVLHEQPVLLQTLQQVQRFQTEAEVQTGASLRIITCTISASEQHHQCQILQGKSAEKELTRAAVEMMQQLPDGRIAVVANTVVTARHVYRALSGASTTKSQRPVFLCGGLRNADLEQRLEQLEHARIVVSTQAIEGAPLSFDGLVTQLAPLEILHLRFALLKPSSPANQAVIVRQAKQAKQAKQTAGGYSQSVLENTWHKLTDQADSGENEDAEILRVDLPAEEDLFPTEAPLLLRRHLTDWSHTSLTSSPDPDILPYVFGARAIQPEVAIIWRADLTSEALQAATADPHALEAVIATIDALPPKREEIAYVPLHVAQAWLQQQPPADYADTILAEPVDVAPSAEYRLALRYGGDASAVISPQAMLPGDLLLVPAAYGGYSSRTGFNPLEQAPVTDIREFFQDAVHTIRMHHCTLPGWFSPDADAQAIQQLDEQLQQLPKQLMYMDIDAMDDYIDSFISRVSRIDGMLTRIQSILQAWRHATHKSWSLYPHPTDFVDDNADSSTFSEMQPSGLLLRWESPDAPHAPQVIYPADDLQDRSSAIGSDLEYFDAAARPITLVDHQHEVAAASKHLAQACGLSDGICTTLELAGKYHDLGKATRRYQAMLHGGDPLTVAASAQNPPMAKSGITSARNSSLLHIAHLHAGYAHGTRHEAFSVEIIRQNLGEIVRHHATVDTALLLHLIGSHHGWGRPWFPAPNLQELDTHARRLPFADLAYTVQVETTTIRIPSESNRQNQLFPDWNEQFAALQRRYGYWGLAYLESILRWADQLTSLREAEAIRSQREDVECQPPQG